MRATHLGHILHIWTPTSDASSCFQRRRRVNGRRHNRRRCYNGRSKLNQSRPSSRILVRSRPASRQEVEEFLSRPASRQTAKDNKPESRPSSRIVKRPVSVASRPASRAVSRCSTIKPVEEEDEEEDWGDEDEWEYYYEEDYSEDTVVTSQVKVMSRPSSRQNTGSRVPSRQEIVRVVSRQDNTTRIPSRQEVEQKRVPSRQEVQERKIPSRNSSRAKSRSDECDATRVPSKIIVRIPSRNGSRPVSRAKSTINKEEYEDDEEQEQISRPQTVYWQYRLKLCCASLIPTQWWPVAWN